LRHTPSPQRAASAQEPHMSFGEEIIDWTETHARVPEGALVGQSLQLMDWQKQEIQQSAWPNSTSDHQRRPQKREIDIHRMFVARPSGRPGIGAQFAIAPDRAKPGTSCNSFFAGRKDRPHVASLE
jgi:hypothetical protein